MTEKKSVAARDVARTHASSLGEARGVDFEFGLSKIVGGDFYEKCVIFLIGRSQLDLQNMPGVTPGCTFDARVKEPSSTGSFYYRHVRCH